MYKLIGHVCHSRGALHNDFLVVRHCSLVRGFCAPLAGIVNGLRADVESVSQDRHA